MQLVVDAAVAVIIGITGDSTFNVIIGLFNEI
jgi:hypothetical protein